MDARMWDVLDALASAPVLTAQDLARRLGVTSRTVRSLVSRSRSGLAEAGASIESKPGSGYRLIVRDQEAFDRLAAGRRVRRGIPTTVEERRRYLLQLLLTARDYVTLTSVAESLYVSPKTLAHDLAYVEETLAGHGLLVDRRPYKGVRVVGAELDIRTCLTAAFHEEGTSFDDLVTGLTAGSPTLAELVGTVVTEGGRHISEEALHSLLLHLAVALNRVHAGRTIKAETPDIARYVTDQELATAHDILDRVGGAYGVEFPREEHYYLALHLAGRRVLRNPVSEEDLGTVTEARHVVDDMLTLADASFGLGLSGDDDLRTSLIQHVIPLIIRLRFSMRLHNPSLERIKQSYPLAYFMAVQACTVLSHRYGRELPDDEAAYVALWFALSLERSRPAPRRKNVLLVVASSGGWARLLEFSLRDELGDLLGSVTVCEPHRLKERDLTGVDAVLTTIPLGTPLRAPLDVPVYVVGELADAEETARLRRLLSHEPSTSIDAVLFPELFVGHLVASDPREATTALVDAARRRFDLPGVFLESVLRREDLAPTDFGNRVAMPHGEVAMSEETFVAIGVLDEPIVWHRHPVQVVCLVSISTREGKDLQSFYRTMSTFLMSRERIDALIAQRTFAGLMAALKETESTMEVPR